MITVSTILRINFAILTINTMNSANKILFRWKSKISPFKPHRVPTYDPADHRKPKISLIVMIQLFVVQ